MRHWYVLIGAYLIMHIVVMTKYTPMSERTELVSWLYALQWLVPTLMLSLLVPRVQRLLDRVVGLKTWTAIGLVIAAMCVALYLTNVFGRWFSWSTLGLLVLLMLAIANSQASLKNTNAWLLGTMVTLLAIGSWEVLYQTGLLMYHDFFGCGMMSYYVTVAMQFLWIIPALIVVLVMYRRGLRMTLGWDTLAYIGISIVCTVLWFVNGMDLPLLWWQGPSGLEGPVVNEAARPLMISISRGSQSFWLLSIATLFVGNRRNI